MNEKLVEVKFLDWVAHPPGGGPAPLLHVEETSQIIPVWINLATTTEYSARETGVTQRRPGMHEVFVDSLDMVGQSVLRGQITGVHKDVFIASLALEGGAEVSMRPSGLILIARELEVPLYVARDVFDAMPVTARLVTTNGGSLADESETDFVGASVSELAEFLDSIDADYFTESHGDVEDKGPDGEANGGTGSASDGDR